MRRAPALLSRSAPRPAAGRPHWRPCLRSEQSHLSPNPLSRSVALLGRGQLKRGPVSAPHYPSFAPFSSAASAAGSQNQVVDSDSDSEESDSDDEDSDLEPNTTGTTGKPKAPATGKELKSSSKGKKKKKKKRVGGIVHPVEFYAPDWGHDVKSRMHWARAARRQAQRQANLTPAEEALRLSVIDYQRTLYDEHLDYNPLFPLGAAREMYEMHLSAPGEWDLARLAAKYGIDQVRVAAVLRLQASEHRERRLLLAVTHASGLHLETIRAHDNLVSVGEEGLLPITDEQVDAIEPLHEEMEKYLTTFEIDLEQLVKQDQQAAGEGMGAGDFSQPLGAAAAPASLEDELQEFEGDDREQRDDDIELETLATPDIDDNVSSPYGSGLGRADAFVDSDSSYSIGADEFPEERTPEGYIKTGINYETGQFERPEDKKQPLDVVENAVDAETRVRLDVEAARFRAMSPAGREYRMKRFLSLRAALGREISDDITRYFGQHPQKYNPQVLARTHNVPVEVVVALLQQEGFSNARLPTGTDETGEDHFVTMSHDPTHPSNIQRNEDAEPSRLQNALRERVVVMEQFLTMQAYMYQKFEELTEHDGVNGERSYADLRAEERDAEEEEGHALRQISGVDIDRFNDTIGWGTIPNYGHLLEEPRKRNMDWPMVAYVHPDEDATEWARAMQDARFNRKVRTRYDWRRGKHGVKLAPPRHELPPSEEELAHYREEEEDLNHAYGGKPTDALDQEKRERRLARGPRKAVLDLLGLAPEEQKRAVEPQILREGRDDYVPWPRIHLPAAAHGHKMAMTQERYIEKYIFIGAHPKMSDAQKPIFIWCNRTGEVRTASWTERRALLNPSRRATPSEAVHKELLPLYALQRNEMREFERLMNEGEEYEKEQTEANAKSRSSRGGGRGTDDVLDAFLAANKDADLLRRSRQVAGRDEADSVLGVPGLSDDLSPRIADEAENQPEEFDEAYRRAEYRKKAELTDWADLDEESRELLLQQAAEVPADQLYDLRQPDASYNPDEPTVDHGAFDPTKHVHSSEYIEPGEEPATGVATWYEVNDVGEDSDDEGEKQDRSFGGRGGGRR